MSWPCCAGTFDPETGASRKRPPRACTSDSRSTMSSTLSVAQSTTALPGVTPASRPLSMRYTLEHASGVLSMTNVTSHSRMTSLGLAAMVTLGPPSADAAA
eukprot:2734002-Pleurochrysis_carterae.AAC.3